MSTKNEMKQLVVNVIAQASKWQRRVSEPGNCGQRIRRSKLGNTVHVHDRTRESPIWGNSCL